MTEQEWLTGADVGALLRQLWPGASRRKLRLFSCACCRLGGPGMETARGQRALELAEAFADGAALKREMLAARSAAAGLPRLAADPLAWTAASRTASKVKPSGAVLALLRDIFNPFRPAFACPAWDGGLIQRFASALYDERAFDRLPLLADLLEEAGITDAQLLGHLCDPGGHVRGCWAVDLLLGKS
jgi:hypothetical protein